MTRTPTPKSRAFVIANPTAGGGALHRKWNHLVRPLLKQGLGSFDFAFTTGPGDATLITRKALLSGHKRVVALGGDGTLNEVVNGFFESGKPVNTKASLAVLPFGSGGDFARSLAIKKTTSGFVQYLTGQHIKPVDVGRITIKGCASQRYFINIAEAGLGACIMAHVNNMNRRLPAITRYLTGTVCGFARYRNIPVNIHLSGPGLPNTQISGVNLTNLIVANGRYFGRGMCPAPKASLDDGLFDVIIIKDVGWLGFLLNLRKMYARDKKVSSRIMETFRAQKITVTSQDPKLLLPCEVDGETCGQGATVTFELLPKVISLLV